MEDLKQRFLKLGFNKDLFKTIEKHSVSRIKNYIELLEKGGPNG